MEMNYIEAREYLKNVNKLGSILGLNTIKELLKRLGNPQNELKNVTVCIVKVCHILHPLK